MIEIRRSFWIILAILIVAVIGYYWVQTKIFIQLIYLSVLLLIGSWVWTMLSTRGLEVHRSARELKQELGKVFEERFEVENHFSIICPWVEVKDESLLPGPGGSRVLAWVRKNERRNYSAYTLLRKRGQIFLGPTAVYSGDPFGIFVNKKIFHGTRSLLVLPHMFDLKWFPFPPGLLPGGKAQRQKTLEVTPHAAGVREYSPGDSLNRIHWPSTARKNRMMVKEFERDPQADVWLLMDACKTFQFSQVDENGIDEERFWFWEKRKEVTIPADTFEYAVSICASVGRFCIRHGKAVGVGVSAQKHLVLPPERGERQLGKILEALAFAIPRGKLPVLGLVQSEVQNIARGSTVVVISSAYDDGIILASEVLIQRDMQPVVILIDPLTFGESKGVEHLLPELHRRSVPVAIISKGDDLQQVLEESFSRDRWIM